MREMRNDPTCGELLALDPSVRSSGVALFRGGSLVAAETVKMSVLDGEGAAARCLRMSHDVVEWVAGQGARPRVLAVEWPAKSWRGDARDLHGLCGVAGAVAGILSLAMALHAPLEVLDFEEAAWSADALTEEDPPPKPAGRRRRAAPVEVVSFAPGQWSGQLPKAKTTKLARKSPRALYIERRLSPAERAVWAELHGHDALDAVGIGLYCLGRMDPARVYPGAV